MKSTIYLVLRAFGGGIPFARPTPSRNNPLTVRIKKLYHNLNPSAKPQDPGDQNVEGRYHHIPRIWMNCASQLALGHEPLSLGEKKELRTSGHHVPKMYHHIILSW